MAKLFKDKAIKKDLEKFEIPNFEEKVDIVKKWLVAYKNKSLHQKTESQCEQAFNQSFFVELLGYTTFPDEIYTLEPKGRTEASAQKPDAILGHFTAEKTRTIAVVEIKDVNTALDRSQKREGNLSPVQQAFKYKPQYKECGFVIATNFFEIRLHKDNQLDYEQFTLESLADPKNDYFELKKFYYLLCEDNFISKTGKTKTENLLSDIRIDQEKITKSFYKEYKLLRQELIKDIVENNSVSKSELLLVVEKAQKIIDRIVFVCFCEDTDLLPEDTLQSVIKHAENSFSGHWDMLKGFFNAIDKGSEKLEIPHGYNGGLFAEDQKLNNLKISDSVCKKFLEFGNYDFSEDLSVNILGHIFEQSISDIEEIKSKTIEGEEVDKKKSKRKKDGIFYTPDYIVDYIVKNSLGKYLEEKEGEIKKKNNLKEDILDVNYKKRALKTYIEYQGALRNVKVLDPACGSGAFLVKVFDYLLEENVRVANIIADLNNDMTDMFSSEDYIKSLLENNIYGVDLNPESVEITKLSLWLKSAQKDRKLVDLKGNIKCGNSLIDDHEVAGERAFKWEDEFKDIMDDGRFDVIVGNPPYGAKFSKTEVEYFNKKYTNQSYQLDSYLLFTEKTIDLIATDGLIGYIMPNTWLSTLLTDSIRKFVFNTFSILEINHYSYFVFEEATVETDTYIFRATKPKNNNISINIIGGNSIQTNTVSQLDWINKLGKPINIYETKEIQSIKLNLEKNKKLGNICQIVQGVKPFQKGKGKPPQDEEIMRLKPFIKDTKVDDSFKPLLRGSLMHRYQILWDNDYWISYGDWLAEPRYSAKFDCDEKIVIRQTGDSLIACFDKNQFICRDNLYVIRDDDKRQNLRFILGIINSKLLTWYFRNILSSEQGKAMAQVKRGHIQELPIKIISLTQQQPFIKKVDLILSLNKQFHERLQKFLKLIQSEFNIETISKKLEKFYELDFDEFIKALKLKRLSLDKKGELLEFFEKYKKELLELKNQIDSTDKEIDEMVFNLYELNEDERRVILNN